MLLARIGAGDMVALEALFQRYHKPVYQLAFGIVRDAQTAEEILQDCFYRLYRHAERLDGTRPLLPWLYRVTVNLCHNARRRRQFSTEPFGQANNTRAQNGGSSPEHVAEQRETQDVVRAVLDELPATHRAVIVLHYLHDYSIAEIALHLNIPEGTVKSRLHHARRVLRERLQRQYGLVAGQLPGLL